MSDAAMPDECWLPVVGWEGFYEVSDQGRVRSLDRWITTSNGKRRFWPGLVLAQSWSGKYFIIGLHAHGRRRTRPIHNMVAAAFLGPAPAGMQVRHGPTGACDNRLANLCYGTAAENAADRRRDGTVWESNKTHCPRGHQLVPPNLAAAAARRGDRDCLACNRARAYGFNARRRGQPFDLQADADRRYKQIMAGEVAAQALS